ncbi:MAG TPA: VWA domain-containing protein [Vicinamibacterales bacterium]
MRGIPRAAVLAISLVLAAATGLAQQPTFRAKVQLVRVDASVVDADGNPVLGLTADDFELFDRGTPQPIATFTAVHHDPPPAVPRAPDHHDVASNTVDDTSQLLVLVLDDLHIRKEWTAHARDVIVEFVRNLGDDVMVALLSTSGKYRVDLTTDHGRILDAINRFVGTETKLAFNAPGSTTSPPGRAGAGFSAAQIKLLHLNLDGPALSPMSSTTGNCRGTLTGPPADSEELFSLFESAAHVLGSDDRRRKGLAWISTGESFAAEGARQAIDALQRSGVVLYAIDPVGTKPVIADGTYDMKPCPGSTTFELVKSPWQVVADNKVASLTNTSRATGGFAVVNDDDLAGGVRKIVQDFGEYYVLGFYPDDLTTAGARPLEVRLKRPGLTVHARLSYEKADATAPSTASALGTLAGGLVPTGDLPLRVYAAALPSSTSGRANIVVTLEVTAKTADLTDDQGIVGDRLQYGVYAVSVGSGKVVWSALRDATLELGHRADPLPPSVSYAVDAALLLAPGHYQVRVSARSVHTGMGGSVFLPLDVPDFHGQPLVMSDLILGESTVPVAAGADFNTLHADRALPFAPTLDRVFDGSRVLRIFATVLAEAREPVTATVSIMGSEDTILWSDHRVLPATGRLDLTVPLASLPPAPYRFRVSATDGPHTVTREVGFVVR